MAPIEGGGRPMRSVCFAGLAKSVYLTHNEAFEADTAYFITIGWR